MHDEPDEHISGSAAGCAGHSGHYEADSTGGSRGIDGGAIRDALRAAGAPQRFLALVLMKLFLYRVLTHLDHHLPSYLLSEG